jgi:hypothetical protein
MKTFFTLLFFSIFMISLSQVKVSNKDIENLIFSSYNDARGNTQYGFYLNDKPIGPHKTILSSGETVYMEYNENENFDGFNLFIETAKETATFAYANDGKLHNSTFQLKGIDLVYAYEYKKPGGKAEDIGGAYKAKLKTQDACLGNCYDGFGLKQYKKDNYAFSFFGYGRKFWTTYHIFPSGDVYRGACILNLREEFGVYTYANGTEYIGQWKKGEKQGLGFVLDKEGRVIEKGIYKDNTLKTAL